jgi:hypothetical protein
MATRVQRFLEWLGQWRTVAVLAVPTLGLFAIFNFHPAAVPALLHLSGGVPPLDLQLAYGPAEVTSLLTAYGVEGRQRYGVFLAADTFFAVCYGLFLAGLLRLILRSLVPNTESGWHYVALLPLFAGVADCLENVSILTLLGAYPDAPPALVYTASTATLVKWLLASAGIFAILVALGLRVVCLIRNPRGRQSAHQSSVRENSG